MLFQFYMGLCRFMVVLVSIGLLTSCMAKGMINLQSGNALAVQRWLGSADSFELPFVWHDGHIIIEVAVNHARSLRFAFDSAAAATVLFDTTKTKSIPLDIERKLDLRGRQVNVVNNGLIQFIHMRTQVFLGMFTVPSKS